MGRIGWLVLCCAPSILLAQAPPLSNAVPLSITQTNEAAAGFLTLSRYAPDDKYKLRIGDRIAFQICEDREPPKSLTVTDSGELDVPYLGRMAAADKTCKQLAEACKIQLEKDYYYRASVVIALE